MSSLVALKKSRSSMKALVTRFKNYLNNYNEEVDDINVLKSKLVNLEAHCKQYHETQDQIEILEEIDIDNAEREDFETAYDTVIGKAQTLIQRRLTQSITTSSSDIVSGPSDDIASNASIKLPTMNLPTFDGRYENWLSFHDTFRALIHDNNTLADIQKFYYLRSCLKDAAAQVIQSLQSSAQNYHLAWDLLKKRFENKPLIISHHFDAILGISSIYKDSGPSLRKMVDDVQKHTRALKVLEADNWDALLIHLLTAKLDTQSKREWRNAIKEESTASITNFIDFLEERSRILGDIEVKRPIEGGKPLRQRFQVSCAVTNQPTCQFCKGAHYVYGCAKFRNLPVQARITAVTKRQLCTNCLRAHGGQCTHGTCKRCSGHHNTLLHQEPTRVQSDVEHTEDKSKKSEINQPVEQSSTSTPVTLNQYVGNQQSFVFLATALIWVQDDAGKLHECRALLDSGSQSNLISKELSNKLSLPRQRIKMPINGVNNTTTQITEQSHLSIHSKYNGFQASIPVLIINSIINQYPSTTLNVENLQIPRNFTLADPAFNIPGKIDLLLGASVFWQLLCAGQHRLLTGQPTLQKTKLGWVVVGNYTNVSAIPSVCCLSTDDRLSEQLELFWKLENCASSIPASEEDQRCETHFVNTHSRLEDGRFMVRLPFRRDASILGDSRHLAIRRLQAMERKFVKQPNLREQYVTFLEEYHTLGHMTDVTDEPIKKGIMYYLPHHAVLKDSSTTTKLRVVFDGSSRTTTNISLNEILMVGPTIQQELLDIVLRFRQHRYAIMADIEKMYRQVVLADEDRSLQHILWRSSPDLNIREYELNTVTYGLGPAPFLAIRCLTQLAKEHAQQFPEASSRIQNDFYVDDLLSGANTLDQAIKLKEEISNILGSARFSLRKWASNARELADQETHADTMIHIGNEVKALGLWWESNTDHLMYRVNAPDGNTRITKRVILAHISQIFDPLGLIGPVVVRGKILIQQLWRLQLGWDESVPLDVFTTWSRYARQLTELETIRIPRWIGATMSATLELHGFCDASEAAYGACVYLRSSTNQGPVTTHLLCAKSKIAPLKKVTLPRLELCGALLLTTLCKRVQEALTVHARDVHFWCDSTITLAWIRGGPHQWTTFVANRVAGIHEHTTPDQWSYVQSADNPADLISRGLEPRSLQHASRWWHGPTWLQRDRNEWPTRPDVPQDVPERKCSQVLCMNVREDIDIFNKYSSLRRLNHVVAYCIRFKHNTLQPKCRRSGSLTVDELRGSMHILLKLMQHQAFNEEIKVLRNNRELPNNSKLRNLNVFLGNDGLLRVGGRLRQADVPYAQKHPIILSPKHALTDLIIRSEHYRSLHAGPQALLANIRLTYWPLSGRRTIRSILRRCVVCFRFRPIGMRQLMGDLPATRVNPSRPFQICGVDYAGPFTIRISRNKTAKAYLCLFICFATRAIHLEVAVDLTTMAFLNAFKRFIHRRGLPSEIHSDNGTNFVGAANELKAVHDLLQSSQHQTTFRDFLNNQAIKWRFNPPSSPHFGGLWEAGVKSVKTHLRKIVGHVSLTYEELYTTFTAIEACLNSRPISPISDDPSDLLPLTPGHFLIGTPMTSLPSDDLVDTNINRLTRFQLITQLTQRFWLRWRKEYLTQLQQRFKWNLVQPTENIIDRLVVLRDDNSPPMLWRMGRIIQIHPGQDGQIRVVSVKTSTGVVQRSTAKLCMLPIE